MQVDAITKATNSPIGQWDSVGRGKKELFLPSIGPKVLLYFQLGKGDFFMALKKTGEYRMIFSGRQEIQATPHPNSL